MDLPPLYRIRQRFDVTAIADVAAAVRDEFSKFDWGDRIHPGQSVAVGVGSRGTHDLKNLVVSTIACLKSIGLKPFVIPAMGSHGGGTGEGQTRILAELGITPDTVEAPIVSNMDVVSLGRSESGAEVFFAKDALDADHIVVINRVKPHTAFRAEVESGLCKILAVGCGRQKGAANMHRYELGKTIVPAARLIMRQASVLCGLAVTENALGGTHSLKLARPEEFAAIDSAFLKTAWNLLPKLPVDDLDILLNAFTSGVLRSARMPIPLKNDRLAVETALYRAPDPGGIRMVRIVNTGELESFWATAAVASELKEQKHITVDDAASELKFSHAGRLLPMTD